MALLLIASAPATATELPAPDLRPQAGTLVLTIVPDRETANRICNPDDARIFADACSRNTGVIIDTPCDYPHERYARKLCHELIHQLLGLYHVERKGKLVWLGPSLAAK